MMFSAFVIVALAGFVSANSYSIGCMTALMNVGANPDVAACLNPSALLPILVGAGNGNDTIIAPVDAWVTGMCGSPACSTATLSQVIKDVSAGCAAEFGSSSSADVQQMIDLVTKSYTTARKVLCLKEADTLCVTQTFTALESITGTLNMNGDNIRAIAGARHAGLPSNVLCSDCMKGAVSIINAELPGEISQDDMNYAKSTCGDAFVDGGIPPSLIQTALGATPEAPPAPSQSSPPVPSPSPSRAPAAAAPPPTQKKSSAVGRLFSGHRVLFAIVIISTAFAHL
ncbi:hypothetical protein BDZ94DRAFT_1251125, partial [Collybia nuda]